MEKTEKVKNNSIGLNIIEDSILKTIEKIRDDYDLFPKGDGNRNNKWITNTIKERIGKIGYENKYDVASTIDDNEWLFDLVWYQNNDKGHLEKAALTLECELSDRNINGLKYDFEKLLISNSDHRIFICFAKGNYNFPQNVNELLEFFDTAVNSYLNLNIGSRILILIWEDYMNGDIHPHLIIKK